MQILKDRMTFQNQLSKVVQFVFDNEEDFVYNVIDNSGIKILEDLVDFFMSGSKCTALVAFRDINNKFCELRFYIPTTDVLLWVEDNTEGGD